MIANKRFCLFLIFLGLSYFSMHRSLNAQEVDSLFFTKDFFEDEKALDISLEFDVRKFVDEKKKEKYFPAYLSYSSGDSIEVNDQVKIKSRGNTRIDICHFPPYFINFKKTDIADSYFSDVKKVKIVSYCKKTKAYERYLVREYLAYKLFNIITDYSFKVRLLRVQYIDSKGKVKPTTKMAFAIEPEKLLAERLDAYPLEMDKANYGLLDSVLTTTMSIFEYMIGNTDFSVAGRHNMKLLVTKDFTSQELIPIPYDFDYAGLVNAHYAVPVEKLHIKSVTERFYRGLCRSDYLYNDILEIYKEKKNEIYSFIDSFEHLDKKSRKYVVKYIDEFYKEIEKENFIRRKIRPTCN